MAETILLSIDIEKGGNSPTKHPILAIGVCVGAVGGGALPRILEKKTWCLRPLPGQEMEERCVREFWSNKQDLLTKITECSIDALDGLRDFSRWLDDLATRFAEREIKLVSDNPAYDIGSIDFALCANGIRTVGIRYLGNEKYRSVCDPSEMIDGQGSWDLVKSKIAANHDHWPENDAEYIWWMYVHACQIRDQLSAGRRLSEVSLD
jgi:hypothetical protein